MFDYVRLSQFSKVPLQRMTTTHFDFIYTRVCWLSTRLYYACRQIKRGEVKCSVILFKIVSVGTRSLKAVTFLTKRLSQLSDAFWKTVSKRISSTWWFSETNQLKVPQFLVVSVECYTAETRFFRNMARATFYFLQKSNYNKKGPVGRQFFIKFPFWSIFCRLRI